MTMKVSVCIPTYNQGRYITQTIQSAAQQSFPPFEIIVSNDCSTDDTEEILQQLSREINCLKVVNQPVNAGMVPNTDAVLRMATGDCIVKLDSDDYLHPAYIEKLVQLLEQYPGAGYAHGAVQEIDDHGNNTRLRILARHTGFYPWYKALRDAVHGYQVAANIIMFRRSALEDVGYIGAQTGFAEDYYLSAQLAAAGYGNVYCNEIISSYRVWADAGHVRQRRKLAEINSLRKVFEEVMEPAYQQRNWSLKKLKECRTAFACQQSDCLSWSLYNAEEKEELLHALSRLSSAPKARLFASVYGGSFGQWLVSINRFKAAAKRSMKSLLYPVVH